jgi:hypothetical protein
MRVLKTRTSRVPVGTHAFSVAALLGFAAESLIGSTFRAKQCQRPQSSLQEHLSDRSTHQPLEEEQWLPEP